MSCISRILAIVALAGFVAACGPRHPEEAHRNAYPAGQNQYGTTGQEFGRHGHGHGHGGGGGVLRQFCAVEIQKYCADADKKRKCLRENSDKLSDSCKTALKLAQERQRERREERELQNGQQHPPGAKPHGGSGDDDDDQ